MPMYERLAGHDPFESSSTTLRNGIEYPGRDTEEGYSDTE